MGSWLSKLRDKQKQKNKISNDPEFRKMQLYNTEKTLEKWQNKYQRRLNSLKYAEQRAEEYRKKYGKEEDPVSL